MENLLRFKNGQNLIGVKSSTFYISFLHQINIYMDVVKPIEARVGLKTFAQKWMPILQENSNNPEAILDKQYSSTHHMIFECLGSSCCIKNKSEHFNVSENSKIYCSRSDLSFKSSISVLRNKQISFINKLREITLKEITKSQNKGCISQLKQLHIYIHLIQLHFCQEKSLFSKINEFLNTNFKLSEGDIVAHALRGNLSKIIDICPRYRDGIVEYIANRNSTHESKSQKTGLSSFNWNAWKLKHQIPVFLYEIFSGKYQMVENDLEYACYKLAFSDLEGMVFQNEYLDVLRGDVTKIKKKGMAGLLINLIFSLEVNSLERLFEEVFLEIVDFDCCTAIRYLSFTKNIDFFYNLLMSKVDYKDDRIIDLVHFAAENHIDIGYSIHRYAMYLQDMEKFHMLCRFLIQNNVVDFMYMRQTVDYFIQNIGSFNPLITKDFLENTTNMFIYEMGNINNLKKPRFRILIENPYFDWYKDDILKKVIDKGDKDACLLGLKKILQCEKQGISIDIKVKKTLLNKFMQ